MRSKRQVIFCLAALLFAMETFAASPDNSKSEGLFTDSVKDAFRASISQLSRYGTFTGHQGFLDRVILPRNELKEMLAPLLQAIHPEDMLLLLTLGWMTVPVLQYPYEKVLFQTASFEKSPAYVMATLVQQAARIAVLVYLVDIIQLVCISFGFEFCKLGNMPHAFAQSTYTAWFAILAARAKKHWIHVYISQHPETYGRMKIVNRFANAAIIVIATVIILNVLKLKMGLATNSFLALGSVGTLTLGLASKDLATQIMNGLLLASSDNIYEGDQVQFGNGLKGTIVSLGWLETVLRGNDEVLISVPNTSLVKQQFSNLSRIRYSEVSQTLKFKYADIDKIPSLLRAIKDEIRLACPKLVTDGSRPFRAVWSNIGPGSILEVKIESHFAIKPIGEEYYENRMAVLHSIRRAIEKTEVTPV